MSTGARPPPYRMPTGQWERSKGEEGREEGGGRRGEEEGRRRKGGGGGCSALSPAARRLLS